jgi:adenylate cyclase
VIDYYGDGLAAFWNCPLTTADHPWLACQTAWQMMSDLETINRAWSSRLPAPLMAGVGINTGVAQVGNSGTQGKLKYGPRGQVVNLASRLEQATKHFGASILLSAATAGHVKDRCRLLRLCRSRLPGFAEPDQIYQLLESAPTDEQIRAAQSYAAALEAYESGRLPECVEIIAAFHQQADDDERFDYLLDQVEKSCEQAGRPFPSATLERRRISIPKSDRAMRPYQASGHESER